MQLACPARGWKNPYPQKKQALAFRLALGRAEPGGQRVHFVLSSLTTLPAPQTRQAQAPGAGE